MKSKIALFLSALSVLTMVGCKQTEPPKQDPKPKSQIAERNGYREDGNGGCTDRNKDRKMHRDDDDDDD